MGQRKGEKDRERGIGNNREREREKIAGRAETGQWTGRKRGSVWDAGQNSLPHLSHYCVVTLLCQAITLSYYQTVTLPHCYIVTP